MAGILQYNGSNDGCSYMTSALCKDVPPLAADVNISSPRTRSDDLLPAVISAVKDGGYPVDADCSTTVLTTSRSNGSSSPEHSAGSPCAQRIAVPALSLDADSDGSESPRSNSSAGSDSVGSQGGALHIENLELGGDAQVFNISTPTGDKITLTPGVECFTLLSPRSDQEADTSAACTLPNSDGASALSNAGGQVQALSKCRPPQQPQVERSSDTSASIASPPDASVLQPPDMTFHSSRQDEQRRKVEMFLNSENNMEAAPSMHLGALTDDASNTAFLHEEVDCDHVSWESSSNASVELLQDA
mmetsp:Transcript_53574/g.96235  ORF Transcript_53574/g.96235 Transcript_53574/m.96235 type:complete len:303 (-) Transcript_53574:370-1278(-)